MKLIKDQMEDAFHSVVKCELEDELGDSMRRFSMDEDGDYCLLYRINGSEYYSTCYKIGKSDTTIKMVKTILKDLEPIRIRALESKVEVLEEKKGLFSTLLCK